MGGRGSLSGVGRISSYTPNYVNNKGRSLSPAEQNNAVSDKANFILRELEQDEAIQIIIRRSFKGGIPEVTLNEGLLKKGLSHNQAMGILKSVDEWINKFKSEYRKTDRNEKNSVQLDKRQTYQSEKKAITQASTELRKARKNLKKNYKL